jgi:hypothetical protein
MPCASVTSVSAVAGNGLEGDRHYRADGQRPGGAITLVEAEVLEEVGLTGPESRRQVVVRGVLLMATSSSSTARAPGGPRQARTLPREIVSMRAPRAATFASISWAAIVTATSSGVRAPI